MSCDYWKVGVRERERERERGHSIMISYAVLMLTGTLATTPCTDLKVLALPGATITAAELVPAGPYTPPTPAGRGGAPAQPMMLPTRCRVGAVLKPSPDSEIEMEAWLPVDNWNGKFQAVGNGGWAGVISYPAMAAALQAGYATASTRSEERRVGKE